MDGGAQAAILFDQDLNAMFTSGSMDAVVTGGKSRQQQMADYAFFMFGQAKSGAFLAAADGTWSVRAEMWAAFE